MAASVEAYRATDSTMKARLDLYCQNLVRIKPKVGGLPIPFKWKRAQREIDRVCREQMERQGYVRLIILKARQLGSSTYVSARYYRKTTMWLGQDTFILTHEKPATKKLFGMAQGIHEEMPDDFRPTATTDNANELEFGGLKSGYLVGTAGNTKGVGRSTNIQNFHGSEVAFWPEAESHFTGVMQAIPLALETEVILESTANGIGNVFHEQWVLAQAGKSDFGHLFLPWFWEEDYRRPEMEGDNYEPSLEEIKYGETYRLDEDQIRWMHYKNIELRGKVGKIGKLFKQEYPACAAEAFQTTGDDGLIDAELVASARRHRPPEDTLAPRVLGVDTARGGTDDTWFIDRKGRTAGGLICEKHDDSSEVVLADKIAHHLNVNPDIVQCYIDITSAGKGVYDILRLTHEGRVTGVVFGSSPTDEDRYVNKRAEIWGRMNEWFKDELGVAIPDDDEMHSHIVGPSYHWDRLSRLQMEDKKVMKKRLKFSPDAGDALALTFTTNLPMQVPPKEGSWRDELAMESQNMGGDWTSV